jgi:hypothetical protein
MTSDGINEIDENLYIQTDPHDGSPQSRGRARAEIERRRRRWEEKQASTRREFETTMFDAQAANEVKRKTFEEALVDRQLAHARALADKQENTAKAVARATQLAAWAAGASALGAIVSAAAAAFQVLCVKYPCW